MISWKIWQILCNPPFSHPLFRRTLINRTALIYEPEVYSFALFSTRFVVELLAALLICSAMFSPIFLILGAIGLLLILNGTGYSAYWAVKASGLISQEREHQTYELHCVSPEGALGVNWAICTGFLHRNGRFEQIHNLVRSLLVIGLVMVGIVAFVMLSNVLRGGITPNAQEEMERSSTMLIHVMAVLAIIYIDHIHSIVLGCLVSIIVPTYTQRRIDTQLGTLGVYIFLQVSAYLLAWLVALVILPAMYQGHDSGLAQISLAVLQVATFYVIREAMIYGLWSHLVRRLNVTSVEEASLGLSTLRLETRP